MSDSFFGGGFGKGRGGSGEDWARGAWEAMENLRGQFERKVGARMGRGDVRSAILSVLAKEPMHGYQIIHEIEERSGGTWKPSPGSVYPTLQLLADEGLIEATESNGRKTYALTDAGKKEAEANAEQSTPWEAQAGRDGGRHSALPKAGMNLAQAVASVARAGTPDQVKQTIDALDEARRKIYGILAQE